MWPGQQPPGGEQNPQDPNANPYKQPGYHQPNPYQQPGYHQPNPYQQPTPQWNPPPVPDGPVPGGPVPPGNNRKKVTVIAITTAVAVVAAAVVTGVLILGGGEKSEARKNSPKPAASPSASASPQGSESPAGQGPDDSGMDNPRAGTGSEIKPVIAGWQPVVSAKRQVVFDVPADWAVKSQSLSTGFEDDKDTSDFPKPLIMMSAPAFAEEDWCETDSGSMSLAAAGTKGALGAKSLAAAAHDSAEMWVYAGYDQKQTGNRKITEAQPFTSKYGLTGLSSSATVTGVKKTEKCTSDGKAFTVAYRAENGDLAIWCFYGAMGVPDEVPEATIRKIMSTLRPLKSAS
jgi:hypothetical protein